MFDTESILVSMKKKLIITTGGKQIPRKLHFFFVSCEVTLIRFVGY
jgi:hypothetical protein